MATATQKITLSTSRDIPFNKLVLSQSNIRRVKAGVSIEELAEDIARRGLLQSLNVRPVLDGEGNETGMFEIPAGGRRYRALELLTTKQRLAKPALLQLVQVDRGVGVGEGVVVSRVLAEELRVRVLGGEVLRVAEEGGRVLLPLRPGQPLRPQ